MECPAIQDHYTLVLIIITFPLWTFFTVATIILLIHYVRGLQHTKLYDKCTERNALFIYHFHIVVGRHSVNYNASDAVLFIDLLDHASVSSVTIQINGYSIYGPQAPFTYKHSRSGLNCVRFSLYRRHPIKDVRSIRAAHNCSNHESRLFVYGMNMFDNTSKENKFFPITTLVKHRTTNWALNTTFEHKSDQNFQTLGAQCHDPFAVSTWPTYMEVFIVLLFVCATSAFLAASISFTGALESVTLHAFVIICLVGPVAAFLVFVYERFIKINVVDEHYATCLWATIKNFYVIIVLILSLTFYVFVAVQIEHCGQPALDWSKSTGWASAILAAGLIALYMWLQKKRIAREELTLQENDTALMKTNSRPQIEFNDDGPKGMDIMRASPLTTARKGTTNSSNKSLGKKIHKVASKEKRGKVESAKDDDGTDKPFADGSYYMRTKNRNSISQYV